MADQQDAERERLRAEEAAKAAEAEKEAAAKLKAEEEAKAKAAEEEEKERLEKEAAAFAAIDPEKKATHPPVHPTQGTVCSVEGCGWTFGDREKGVEPHPVETISTAPKMTPLGQPVVAAPEPKPSHPDAHPAVPRGAECPKCKWKYGDAEAHPTL